MLEAILTIMLVSVLTYFGSPTSFNDSKYAGLLFIGVRPFNDTPLVINDLNNIFKTL